MQQNDEIVRVHWKIMRLWEFIETIILPVNFYFLICNGRFTNNFQDLMTLKWIKPYWKTDEGNISESFILIINTDTYSSQQTLAY